MFSIEKALPSLGSDCNVRCVKISLEDTTGYNVIKVQPRLNDMKRVERSQSRNGISFFYRYFDYRSNAVAYST